jgi:hypothetical protein
VGHDLKTFFSAPPKRFLQLQRHLQMSILDFLKIGIKNRFIFFGDIAAFLNPIFIVGLNPNIS